METSFEKATALGYDVIVIFGSPANYVARGFKSCKKLNVCADNGRDPAAMLVKELVPGALDGRKWVYRDSPVMAFSEEEVHFHSSRFLADQHAPTPLTQQARHLLHRKRRWKTAAKSVP